MIPITDTFVWLFDVKKYVRNMIYWQSWLPCTFKSNHQYLMINEAGTSIGSLEGIFTTTKQQKLKSHLENLELNLSALTNKHTVIFHSIIECKVIFIYMLTFLK